MLLIKLCVDYAGISTFTPAVYHLLLVISSLSPESFASWLHYCTVARMGFKPTRPQSYGT